MAISVFRTVFFVGKIGRAIQPKQWAREFVTTRTMSVLCCA